MRSSPAMWSQQHALNPPYKGFRGQVWRKQRGERRRRRYTTIISSKRERNKQASNVRDQISTHCGKIFAKKHFLVINKGLLRTQLGNFVPVQSQFLVDIIFVVVDVMLVKKNCPSELLRTFYFKFSANFVPISVFVKKEKLTFADHLDVYLCQKTENY